MVIEKNSASSRLLTPASRYVLKANAYRRVNMQVLDRLCKISTDSRQARRIFVVKAYQEGSTA